MTNLDAHQIKTLYKGLVDLRIRVIWALPNDLASVLGPTSPMFKFRV